MKNEIKRLEKIKTKVFSMYSYTEGINDDITNYVADEIDSLKRSIN